MKRLIPFGELWLFFSKEAPNLIAQRFMYSHKVGKLLLGTSIQMRTLKIEIGTKIRFYTAHLTIYY